MTIFNNFILPMITSAYKESLTLSQFLFQVGKIITSKELLVTDEDTPSYDIMYIVTSLPKFGFLENTRHSGQHITSFTQSEKGAYLFVCYISLFSFSPCVSFPVLIAYALVFVLCFPDLCPLLK